MKKTFLSVALLTAALATAPAFANPPAPDGPDGHRTRWAEGGHRQERLATILGLSQEQQDQIRAIREAARQTAQPLRDSLVTDREKLRALIETVPFDEAAVRALAAREASARTELLVVRARTQNQIHALLTPEQRSLAEWLRSVRHERRGHRGPGPEGDDGEL